MKYVISDIHGRLDKYKSILELIEFSDQDELYILGDAIDRGPDSLEVIKNIMSCPNMHMLMGNHEFMAIETILSEDEQSQWEKLDLWEYNGGAATYSKLLSLDSKERDEIAAFLVNLPTSIETDVNGQRFHMVHGFPADNMKAQVWTRPKPNAPNPFMDRTLIIGHTPVMLLHGNTNSEIQKYIRKLRRRGEHLKIEHTDGFIDIDCGCSTGAPESRLACLRLDDMKEFYA